MTYYFQNGSQYGCQTHFSISYKISYIAGKKNGKNFPKLSEYHSKVKQQKQKNRQKYSPSDEGGVLIEKITLTHKKFVSDIWDI